MSNKINAAISELNYKLKQTLRLCHKKNTKGSAVYPPLESSEGAWEAWLSFQGWVEKEDSSIQEVAYKYPLGLYWLESSSYVAELVSYGKKEDGSTSLNVRVLQKFNPYVLLSNHPKDPREGLLEKEAIFEASPEDLKPLSVLSDPRH